MHRMHRNELKPKFLCAFSSHMYPWRPPASHCQNAYRSLPSLYAHHGEMQYLLIHTAQSSSAEFRGCRVGYKFFFFFFMHHYSMLSHSFMCLDASSIMSACLFLPKLYIHSKHFGVCCWVIVCFAEALLLEGDDKVSGKCEDQPANMLENSLQFPAGVSL